MPDEILPGPPSLPPAPSTPPTAPAPRPRRPDRRALRRLREPIPERNISKRPKVYCWACNSANEAEPGGTCREHVSRWCTTCRSYVSNAHEHDEYVGHAEVTDVFLEADLLWNWEPLAFDDRGLPQFDDDGGLWIRLTIGGVTRLGYGHASGKTGGAAVNEAVSNALKNSGIRFGTALNQRAQTDLHARPTAEQDPAGGTGEDDAPQPVELEYARPDWIARVNSQLARRGVHGQDRLRELSEILERDVTDVAKLSQAEARDVVRILSAAPDPQPSAAAAAAAPSEPEPAAPAAAPEPPTEPAPVPDKPEPTPARATPAARPSKRRPSAPPARPATPAAPAAAAAPTTSRPGPGLIRTINSLLSSRGVAEHDTTERMRIISAALKRRIRSMGELDHADVDALIYKLGSGEASVDPPPPAAAADSDAGAGDGDGDGEPDRAVFDDICAQIARAATAEDGQLIKVEIGKALTTGSITQAEGAALSARLDKRSRHVGSGGGS